MDNCLKVLDYHDCLHGFLAGRGTGTATTEVKLAQQLAYIEQVPLYGVFIDLRKVYDVMDRGRCFEILKAYGVGPKMLKLIDLFVTAMSWYAEQGAATDNHVGHNGA